MFFALKTSGYPKACQQLRDICSCKIREHKLMRHKAIDIYKSDNTFKIVYCTHNNDHRWTIADAFSILVSTILKPVIKHHLHSNKTVGSFARRKLLTLAKVKL